MNSDRIVELIIVVGATVLIFSLFFDASNQIERQRETCSQLLTRAPDRLDSLEIVLQVPICEPYLTEKLNEN